MFRESKISAFNICPFVINCLVLIEERMKWEVQVTGEMYDLFELEKSLTNDEFA